MTGNTVIPSWLRQHLTDADLIQIHQAVSVAEENTIGEIVPMIEYSTTSRATVERLWQVICLILVVPALGLVLEPLQMNLVLEAILILAAALGILFFSVRILRWYPRLAVRLMANIDVSYAVHQRALFELHHRRLTRTEKRTGVLLFVSWLEHKVVVIGDSGISQVLNEEDWLKIVRGMSKDLAAGNVREGFLTAIQEIGQVLKTHFPVPAGDANPNEVGNSLIISGPK